MLNIENAAKEQLHGRLSAGSLESLYFPWPDRQVCTIYPLSYFF